LGGWFGRFGELEERLNFWVLTKLGILAILTSVLPSEIFPGRAHDDVARKNLDLKEGESFGFTLFPLFEKSAGSHDIQRDSLDLIFSPSQNLDS
jgi:hypothetical protein